MIARDKILHAAAGALCGLTAIWIGWWALLVGCAAGIGKEVYDSTGRGTVDKLDAIWTIVGCALVVVIICSSKLL